MAANTHSSSLERRYDRGEVTLLFTAPLIEMNRSLQTDLAALRRQVAETERQIRALGAIPIEPDTTGIDASSQDGPPTTSRNPYVWKRPRSNEAFQEAEDQQRNRRVPHPLPPRPVSRSPSPPLLPQPSRPLWETTREEDEAYLADRRAARKELAARSLSKFGFNVSLNAKKAVVPASIGGSGQYTGYQSTSRALEAEDRANSAGGQSGDEVESHELEGERTASEQEEEQSVELEEEEEEEEEAEEVAETEEEEEGEEPIGRDSSTEVQDEDAGESASDWDDPAMMEAYFDDPFEKWSDLLGHRYEPEWDR